MLLTQLNLNELRVFAAVYRTKSMTLAGRELHLTQSGVSQHVASLEKSLGLKLFDRVHRNLVPTESALELFDVCKQSLQDLEETVLRMRGASLSLKGTVRVGMPSEFGNNLVIPLLARFARENPELNFELSSGFSSDFLDRVVTGGLDFAIVDEFVFHPSVQRIEVYSERLNLCAHSSLWKKPQAGKEAFKAACLKLPFVDYDKNASLVSRWFKHHFGKGSYPVRLRATASQVQSVAALIAGGVGAGVLPHRLCVKLKKDMPTIQWIEGPKAALANKMGIAELKGRSHSPGVVALKNFLAAELQKI